MIKIDSLSKAYGNKQVIKNIDLEIGSGEIHGIIGKNGSGKTTLFKCLAGLEKFEGKIDSSSSGVLKNETGFLSTTPPIISKITGNEYLKLMCSARNIKYDSKTQENIFELPLNKYIDTYSSGMMKKLAIHGVLLQKNQFFLLDEPFNGLDYQSNLLVIEIIKKLKSLGKTVLLSSHIFSTLQDTCDYIHHLKEGIIQQSVAKSEFPSIENFMKDELIGNKIDKLNIL